MGAARGDAESLERGIERAAAALDEMAEMRPGSAADLAALLGMSNVPQTRRMACAILANALVFHERIAGMHTDIKHLRQLGGPAAPTLQDAVLAAWESILAINYYPIFAIAKDLLTQLPSAAAAQVLDTLRPTAQVVAAAGVDNAHDLTGRVFQRLIADRKYLATLLDTAQEIFEEFRDKELMPAYLADADPNRALLDKRVICDLLGFEESVYQGVRRLSVKWCAEPSVNGGKARPKGARLVV